MKITKKNVQKLSWRALGYRYRNGASKVEKQLVRNELRRCGYLMAELAEFLEKT